MRWNRVGVLMGGLSAEREVSLMSGRAVAAGLRKAGFDVVEIDVDRKLDQQLRAAQVEAVYIALHGRLGEDGTVQGLLEVMGIPYTGSSVLGSALAMDKARAREVLLSNGLPVTECVILTSPTAIDLPGDFRAPLVVKPVDEGSSVGIAIVKDAARLPSVIRDTFGHSNRVMVEKFVSGIEITVTVLNGKALGATEIETSREFYDFSAKYDEGGSRHHTPPRVDTETTVRLFDLAERAYVALGCDGPARVDFIVAPDGGSGPSRPVVLEVNTIPGMTQTSLVPEVAAYCGLSFERFVEQVMNGATLHYQPK